MKKSMLAVAGVLAAFAMSSPALADDIGLSLNAGGPETGSDYNMLLPTGGLSFFLGVTDPVVKLVEGECRAPTGAFIDCETAPAEQPGVTAEPVSPVASTIKLVR